MKIRILFPLIILFITFYSTSAQYYPEGKNFINEISFGLDNQAEYIEIIVLGNDNAPGALVSLENTIIDNHTDLPSFEFGNESRYIALGNCFTAIPPGSIILIYNDAKSHTQINPSNDGLPNQSGTYQIPISSTCIQGRKFANINEQDYTINQNPINTNNKTWNDFIGLYQNGDALQLRSSNGNFNHSIRWGDSSYPFSSEVGAVKITGLPTDTKEVILFPGDCDWNEPAHELVTLGSPGADNSPF